MLVVIIQSVLVLTVFWFTVDFRTSAGTAVIEDLCVCHTGGDCPECTCAIFFVTCVSILVPSSLLISGRHRVLQDPPVLHAGGGYPECSVLVPTVFFVTCVSILVPSSLLISGYHRVP